MKRNIITIIVLLVTLLMMVTGFLLNVHEKSHPQPIKKGVMEKRNIKRLFNEKHEFPFKNDTINVNSCFELVFDSGKVVSHKIVCVCNCDEYKNK